MNDEADTVEDVMVEDDPQSGMRVGVLTMSLEIGKITAAIAKAQSSTKPIKKGKSADAGTRGKYEYADLASVLEATMPAFGAHGIAVIQGVSSQRGCVHITTVLAHDGEWMSSTLTIPVGQDAAQQLGSAITYGRRYAIMAMCGKAPEDDDGKAAHDGAVENGGRALRNRNRPQATKVQDHHIPEGRPQRQHDKTSTQAAFEKILHRYQQEEFGKDGNSPPWKKVAMDVSGFDPWPSNPTDEQLKYAIGKFEAKMGGGGPS